jgi:hypothetical protein
MFEAEGVDVSWYEISGAGLAYVGKHFADLVR